MGSVWAAPKAIPFLGSLAKTLNLTSATRFHKSVCPRSLRSPGVRLLDCSIVEATADVDDKFDPRGWASVTALQGISLGDGQFVNCSESNAFAFGNILETSNVKGSGGQGCSSNQKNQHLHTRTKLPNQVIFIQLLGILCCNSIKGSSCMRKTREFTVLASDGKSAILSRNCLRRGDNPQN